MYRYRFRLTPSQPNSAMDFMALRHELLSAIEAVNGRIAFRRGGKRITDPEIHSREILLTLTCKTPLEHAARSLTAVTRCLITDYPETFAPYLYHKTLFRMELITRSSSFDDLEVNDTDLLKGVIDLLFTCTTTTKDEADLRAQTISTMKELIKPYIRR